LKKTDIKIIILAKQEDDTIGEFLKELKMYYEEKDIVAVVAPHSEITSKIIKKEGIVVYEDNGKGKGAAIKFAINNIASEILVFIDTDGSHAPKEIPLLINPLLKNEADLVIGSRFKGKSEELSGTIENFMRLLGNIISTLIINILWRRSGKFMSDCQNGFRAIKSDVARKLGLLENSFAIEQEMVIKCLKKCYRIAEIPSYEHRRKGGKSHIYPFFALPRYILCFLREMLPS